MSIKVPIVVEYFGSKGIKKAIKEFNSLKTNGQRAAFTIKKAFQGIALAAAGLAAAAAAAGIAMFNFAKAAAEDQTSQALLAKQLRTTTKATDAQIASVEDWIGKLQIANGIADSELRPNLAKLVRATKSVSKAQKLLTLALDVSAGSGRDLDSVVTGLARAYATGNLQGLTRMGIALDKNIIKSKDFAKAQAELQKQFGGAAATKANTFQGSMARLSEVFSELKEKAGYVLLEPLKKLADIGVKIFEAFGERGAAGALEELKKGFATLFWNDKGQLNAAGEALNHLIDLLNKLAKAGIIAASAAGGGAVGSLFPIVGTAVGATTAAVSAYAYTRMVDTRLAKPLEPFNPLALGPGTAGQARMFEQSQNITVMVNNGDPQAVIRAIKKYAQQNGRLLARTGNLGSS